MRVHAVTCVWERIGGSVRRVSGGGMSGVGRGFVFYIIETRTGNGMMMGTEVVEQERWSTLGIKLLCRGKGVLYKVVMGVMGSVG